MDSSLHLRGGTWFDTATGDRARRDVMADGGHLTSAEPHSDVAVFDASGLTVMYGLWDCHAHAGGLMYDPEGIGWFEDAPSRTIRAGQNFLDAAAMGVTGIRCVDEANDLDLAWGRAYAEGVPVGPRVVGAGRGVRTTGGHGTGFPRVHTQLDAELIVDGSTEMARAVRQLVERGAHWVKLMLTGGIFSEHETVDGMQFTKAELAAVMEVAGQRGIPVAAHCGGSGPAITFSKLGGRSVEHGYALDDEAAAVMAANGTWLVPTIGVTHDQDFITSQEWPEHAAARTRTAMQAHGDALRACLDAGVRIAVGADLNPIGQRLHREIQLLEAAGMERLDVLHAATVGGRELNGFGAGSLPEPGAVADLVVVDGDPLEDPNVLADPVLVVAHGRVVAGSATTAPMWVGD